MITERPTVVASFVYHDAGGVPVACIDRIEPGRNGRKKEFLPRLADGDGFATQPGLQGTTLPLYRLPEVRRAAESGNVVVFTEGEGKADTLRAAFQVQRIAAAVTTIAGGAAAKLAPAHLEAIRGAQRVVVLADSDPPGRAAAERRANQIADVALDVRVVDLFADHNDGSDVADWLVEGHDVNELRALVEAASPIGATHRQDCQKPPFVSFGGVAQQSDGSLSAASGSFVSGAWRERREIDTVQPVLPLPSELVPDPFREWVNDTCKRLCVPTEFIAVPAIIAAGATIGRQASIEPEPGNPWREIPNLWGMLVAEPGTLKSPAQAEALGPLRKRDELARNQFEAEIEQVEERRSLAKLDVDALEQRYKASKKADASTMEIEAELQARRSILNERAVERRMIVQDATTEKLGEILRDNSRGVLQVRDELIGWLRSMDRQGREADRAFYLEAWNGSHSFTVDRIGRGSIHIPAVCLSVLGTIQPGPLQSYVADATSGDRGADGLLQRFSLVALCAKAPPYQKLVGRPDPAVRQQVDGVFAILDDLGSLYGRADEQLCLNFDTSAQSIFDEWRATLEDRLRTDGDSSSMRAYLAKQRKTVPALALIFHLIDVAGGRSSGSITGKALLMACAWAEVFESHVRSLYDSAIASPATCLASKIVDGDVIDGMTVRDLKRRQWSGLSEPIDVEHALTDLAECNWLRVEEQKTAGRSAMVLRLHPDFTGENK